MRWRDLDAPVSGAGLAALRSMLGAILLFSVVRFWANGWIESVYIEPSFHFSYPGFEWATAPTSASSIYSTFLLLAALATSLMLGIFPRITAALFCVLFTYVELWDRTTYLNHYYFVSLLTALLALLPTEGHFSLHRDARAQYVPLFDYAVVRAFVLIVYVWAGVAKLNADWLLHGEPLLTWLKPHAAWCSLGGLVSLQSTALAMSWGGALFDLGVGFFLLHPRTRSVAFLIAVGFHVTVGLLFPIGVFPLVMIAAITIFFAPDWPRSLTPRRDDSPGVNNAARSVRHHPLLAALFTLFLTAHALIPARSFLYPGHANWNDDGFKWSWRVMLVERVGTIEYEVITARGTHRVHPRGELTPQQYKMLGTTPDMILEYARWLGERHAREGDVRVFARSHVAFNGRRSRPYIDPRRDLLKVSRLQLHDFVLPAPE